MKTALKIKVCGLADLENIREVCAMKPDFAGYIFYPGSRRYVGKEPDPEIFKVPGKQTAKVGVFVNEAISNVKSVFSLYHLDYVQLHGSESPRYCHQLHDDGIPVIKATSLEDLQSGAQLEDYLGSVRFFLFDTPGAGHGGTGQKFNWNLLDGMSIPLPFMLSGGIGPEDAALLDALGHDRLFGIDVNSRFEHAPGIKNTGLLKEFFKEIRNVT